MHKTLILALIATIGYVRPALGEELNIAYVDMGRALNEVEQGKAAKSKLKKEFAAKQKKLDELQNDLKKKQEEFEKRKAMMKESVRQEKLEELQRGFFELQQTYGKLQRELLEQETKVTQGIAAGLRKVIEKIGDRDEYHVIMNIGDTVLYYKRHRDITDDVVKAYNKQYGDQ
ncbi:MAG: OmpH family outer membrane protein [Myxococcota bacterium]